MNSNRREFLKLTGVALGALALPGSWIADAAMLDPGMPSATKRELATLALKTARDLGAALKHFRTAAAVTQVDAAEAMGIGQPYLSSLEGGKFGSSLTHALRLLRFVDCEVVVRPRVPRD